MVVPRVRASCRHAGRGRPSAHAPAATVEIAAACVPRREDHHCGEGEGRQREPPRTRTRQSYHDTSSAPRSARSSLPSVTERSRAVWPIHQRHGVRMGDARSRDDDRSQTRVTTSHYATMAPLARSKPSPPCDAHRLVDPRRPHSSRGCVYRQVDAVDGHRASRSWAWRSSSRLRLQRGPRPAHRWWGGTSRAARTGDSR